MKFDYRFERKDFENYLKDSNKKYNYICLVVFTIFYFGACLDLFSTNAFALIVSYIISVIILFSILKLVATIFIKFVVKRNDKVMDFAYGVYKIELADTKIIEKIGDKTFEIAYQDIYHITKNDKYLILYPKEDKMMYLFIKKLFSKEETYEKCVAMILDKYESIKEGKEIQEKPVKEEVIEKKSAPKIVSKETTKKTSKKPSSKNTSKKKTQTKKAK